jgi:hypothetical protein
MKNPLKKAEELFGEKIKNDNVNLGIKLEEKPKEHEKSIDDKLWERARAIVNNKYPELSGRVMFKEITQIYCNLAKAYYKDNPKKLREIDGLEYELDSYRPTY